MNRYLVQLDFISFIKFNSLSFCCANTLFSPFNALFTFESSGIGRALLALFLAPFAGLLLGAVFGVLAYPLYRFVTSAVSSDISWNLPDKAARNSLREVRTR